ncbi:MAG: hypothetical protein ABIO86_04750 [Sphingomonas sp.]
MRFAQTRWVALAFLLSAVATGYYLLVWPNATFLQCWNGYAQIPPEEGWSDWRDLKGCQETSEAEALRGNVRAAELAAFIHSAVDKNETMFFYRRAVELGSERTKSILASRLREEGLKNCPEILGLVRSYRPSGKYPDAERSNGLILADIKKECEEHLATTRVK